MDWLNDIPEWLCQLFTEFNLTDIKTAVSNVTMTDLKHLSELVKDQKLNANLIKGVYEKASHLLGAGNPKTAMALVVTLLLCFPMAVIAPLLSALGFTQVGPLLGSIAAWLQSTYGANAVFSFLQSAGMGGYGASTIATVVRTAALVGGVPSLAKDVWNTWGWGNGTKL